MFTLTLNNREKFISHRDGSLVLREITLFLRGASDQIGMKPYILGVASYIFVYIDPKH